MSDSIAFDQAAEYYDETRSLPPPVHDAVIDQLVHELRGRGECLEIGVGTGRIARSLRERGIPMTGADLSEPMLRRLVANAGGRRPFPLVRADATSLPFRDSSFDAGIACHVFHLIPPWRDAVAELVRVVRAGGLLLIEMGGAPGEVAQAIAGRFEEEVGAGPLRVGLTELSDLDAALEDSVRRRDLDAIPYTAVRSAAEVLDLYEQNKFGITWSLDEGVRLRATEATRRWAEETYGDLTTVGMEASPIVWRAYEL